ncbi:hypothetical protein [Lederbergia citrea]|uniref:Uncharacterized protein n=1 Tax=Lederbergia citrea TaxID=2833581 RepID=A0A942Z204_9BACI|nr:hypothetical protein [Lederbergia citrea]MBS4176754.1 hypothetical protein [Lederbergia citrea]MBS4203315.1 hypothetical protein [Lederbergia citrea]MBS4222013.1 hypothetical protein [Lederbergia citrea]
MKTNQMFRSTRNNGSNKIWVSLLATLGLSAAVYGLQKYKNGKYMRPIQNILSKTNTNALPTIPALAVNTITEFSKEIAPGATMRSQNAGQNSGQNAGQNQQQS